MSSGEDFLHRGWGRGYHGTQQDTLYYALFSVHITAATMHDAQKLYHVHNRYTALNDIISSFEDSDS